MAAISLLPQRFCTHRTPLYYRLDRILELTGIDLRLPADLTSLQLALWLAAYREVDL